MTDHASSPTPSERHLLTVIHSAERSGPPILALRFLRWLRHERPGWLLSTVSLGGDTALIDEFAALGPTRIVSPRRPDRVNAIRRGAARLANAGIWAQIRRDGPIDVAHVHCVGSMRILDVVPARIPVLCHVHELSVGQDFHLSARAEAHLRSARRFVTVADTVTQELVTRFALDRRLVDRQWGFVAPADFTDHSERHRLGLADDDFLVVSSGMRHWRKAPELFVRVARAASLERPDIPWKFIWIGGSDDVGLRDLIQAARLDGLVRFVDHQSSPRHWIASADVFLLPAREDAFPLVCVEAAALGVPIVTFANGGAVELIDHAQCGRVVPFPDVDEAAATLIDLALDPTQRRALGERARSFAQVKLGVESAGPMLLEALVRTMR